MSTNQKLLTYTSQMPCKQININGSPYIQRYWAGESPNGDYWLHRFLSCDGDRHLHNHQWKARSIVLSGAVTEEIEGGDTITRAALVSPMLRAHSFMKGVAIQGHERWIMPDTWHRISHVEPETWTLLEVYAGRSGKWAFMEDDGSLVEMQGSPRDWWRGYRCRGENVGDVL